MPRRRRRSFCRRRLCRHRAEGNRFPASRFPLRRQLEPFQLLVSRRPATEPAPIKNQRIHRHPDSEFRFADKKCLHRNRRIDATECEVRPEFLEHRPESGAPGRSFSDGCQLTHSLGTIVNAQPQDLGATRMRKRTELVESHSEGVAACRRPQPCRYRGASVGRRRAEESQSEVPVRRRHWLAGKSVGQSVHDRASRFIDDGDTNEKSFRLFRCLFHAFGRLRYRM